MTKLKLNNIHLMDCLEGLKQMPSNSVDLVCTDPPYNIKKEKWDTWASVEEYVEFMGQVFTECQRVLKPQGSLYWFHNDMEQIRKLMDYLDNHTEFIYKQFITWNKISPDFRNYGYVQQRLSIDMMRNFYNGFTEYCLFYVLNDDKHLNDHTSFFVSIKEYLKQEHRNSKLRNKEINTLLGNHMAGHYFGNSQWAFPSEANYKKLQTTGHWAVPYEDLHKEYLDELERIKTEKEQMRYPFNTARVKEDLRANSNVWLYPPAKNLGHITPKPVEMIENIIKHSTHENQVVLDPFMGSGTTAVACVKNNRQFIGFELEEPYHQLAMERIEGEKLRKL